MAIDIIVLEEHDNVGQSRANINYNFEQIKDHLTNSSITIGPAPENENAEGSKGEIILNGNYLYICIQDNQWIRFAVETIFDNQA